MGSGDGELACGQRLGEDNCIGGVGKINCWTKGGK